LVVLGLSHAWDLVEVVGFTRRTIDKEVALEENAEEHVYNPVLSNRILTEQDLLVSGGLIVIVEVEL
jgi:hypothetical protein